MLQSVIKTNYQKIEFEYDVLGRRSAKITILSPRAQSRGLITRFLWDGNVPIHEWQYNQKERPQLVVNEDGILEKDKPEPLNNLITWIFDAA